MNTETKEQAPAFEPFEWVSPGDQANTGRYTMLSKIRDLAGGVGLALQMIERSEIDRERGDTPIINDADALRFTRMSIAAMHVIEDYIDEHFDDMSNVAAEKRRAEKLREKM